MSPVYKPRSLSVFSWRVRITALQELLNTSADAQRLLTMLERKVSEEIYHLAMRALSADLSHSIAS